MHKQDIAAKIARKTDLDDRAAQTLVNLVLAEVTAGLKKGQRVTLTGFGTFVVRKKKKRAMHDIHTGKTVMLAAHKAVGFIVGGPLKKAVR